VTDCQYHNGILGISIPNDIRIAPEIDNTFSKFRPQILDRTPELRLMTQNTDTGANCADGALCCSRIIRERGIYIAVVRREKRAVTKSSVACRRLDVVAVFQLLKPFFDFLAGQMHTRRPILFPGTQCVLAERFTLLFTIHILLDGFFKKPIRLAVTAGGQFLKPLVYIKINLYTGLQSG
jgi:hypothetical protein